MDRGTRPPVTAEPAYRRELRLPTPADTLPVMTAIPTVALVTLGCARNEVDSEELAGRLTGGGWRLVEDPRRADAVVVNTCGFIEAAKRESVDVLLAAADTGAKVVAVGCLAERYGAELADGLPEADAVLSFDDYRQIGDRLDDVLAGRPVRPHRPRDRRRLLPLAPADRPGRAISDLPAGVAPPSGPRPGRRRLAGGPVAPLKLASGCDRRCSFCAIPSFRGAFLSRPPEDVLAEAAWLAGQGVRELVLVSENSTSYGKDLGDLRLLEGLLPGLAAIPGVVRVRLTYLQPAEVRPTLLDAITGTPGVAAYADLSFQHASEPVLRRMRRFGSTERFLGLLAELRTRDREAGARSNVIVGFPGETQRDVRDLERFLELARLDAVGVFGYSDEDGTEARSLPGKVRRNVLNRRVDRVTRLAEELTRQRAEERVGGVVQVLVEKVTGRKAEGRAAHQAPEVDGSTTVHGDGLMVGDLVSARVCRSRGVDLDADLLAVLDRPAVPGTPAGVR
jgi:ribosomal protein S12 methylthiotransferase